MYAFTPDRTLCLVDEDFYLAIYWIFYGVIDSKGEYDQKNTA